MKHSSRITGLLFLLLFAPSNAAVALQGRSDLDRVFVSPGEVRATLGSRYQAGERRARGTRDADVDAAATRMVSAFSRMTLEEIEAILNELDPGRRSTLSARALASMDVDELAWALEDDPDFASRVIAPGYVADEGEYVGCGREAIRGRCEGGVKCITLNCMDGETLKLCSTWASSTSTFTCPNFSFTTWHCDDPCPVPPWTFLAGALLPVLVFGFKRVLAAALRHG